MTKSINGFTINDVFQWLAKKNYLTDDPEIIKKEMINDFELK